MEAVLLVTAIKPFVKALSALSKYGDELQINATSDHLDLYATNSSKSAYGRLKIYPEFFSKYTVGSKGLFDRAMGQDDELEPVTGSVLVKALLSIFKHRAIEKSVERCELSIVDNPTYIPSTSSTSTQNSQSSSSSTTLILRFYCKHGVTKTHRLPLSVALDNIAPSLPENDENTASVTVGPRAIKDLIEHFARTKVKGSKMDLPLSWTWDEMDVKVKSLRGFGEKNSDSQIATAITLEADELDEYIIPSPPITLSFHLREFMAATILAEALSLQLNITLTQAGEPIVITIENDAYQTMFFIQTREVPQSAQGGSTSANKRAREVVQPVVEQRRKAQRVATPTETSHRSSASGSGSGPAGARSNVSQPAPGSGDGGDADTDQETFIPPASFAPMSNRLPLFRSGSQAGSTSSQSSGPRPPAASLRSMPPPPLPLRTSDNSRQTSASQTAVSESTRWSVPAETTKQKPPLFFPFSQTSDGLRSPPIASQSVAQLSQVDVAIIKESGLGIESMTEDEIAAMFEDEDDDDEAELFGGPSKMPPAKGKGKGKEVVGNRQSSPDWEMMDGSVSGGTRQDEGIQVSQMDAKVATRRDKHFTPLAFDDD